MGLILKSASYEPGGNDARERHLQNVVEGAGYEMEHPPASQPEETNDAGLTEPERLEKNLKHYEAQVQDCKRRHKDWDETVNQDLHIGQAAQLSILEQSNGAEICYYLGQHPTYAKKLGKMPPLKAAAAIGRLSDELGGHTPAPQRRPARPSADASFAEIAAMPDYRGKARDLKRAQRR